MSAVAEREASSGSIAYDRDGSDSLIRQAVNGSKDAVDRLWKTHQPLAYRFALRLCGSPDVAADLASQGFVKALIHLPSFHQRCRFSTWLCGIIRNEYLDESRRSTRISNQDYAAVVENGQHASIYRSRMEPDIHEGQVDRLLLEHAIAKLPDAHRACVELYYFQSLSGEEIAGQSGMIEATVKTRLFRARKLLKKELWFLENVSS